MSSRRVHVFKSNSYRRSRAEVVMNFGTLPPETNSGRMYSGPGSGSMIEAATIWDGLAAQLHDMAADYGAVTAKLAGAWQGPAAMAIPQAAAPYLAWLSAAGAQAQQ